MSNIPNDPNAPGGYGGAPSYGGAPTGGSSASNPMAIVALVLGILSILTCLVWFASVPLGIAAIVLGVLAGKKVQRGEAGQGGLAKAGLITGIVGVVASIAFIGLTLAGLNFLENSTGCDIDELSQTEYEECLTDQLNS